MCLLVYYCLQKRKREAYKDLEENQGVNAVVEIVKENYLVSCMILYIIHFILILNDVLNDC